MISESDSKAVVEWVLRCGLNGRALRQATMERLAELGGYAWTGIYRLEGQELVLDAFVGKPTEHLRIPVGRGVCGTAVAEGRNQVVQDVTQVPNYLSCSIETRAEIVVLIRSSEGEILGQIDVDGHSVGCFDASDEAMLGQIADVLAERWA